MTITSFNDLRSWFQWNFDKGATSKEEGRETTSPYWTLYAVGIGGKDTILAYNDRLTGFDESFTALAARIREMNTPPGSLFRVSQTYRARHNYATAEARVQIFENGHQGANVPGIGSLPGAMIGYVPEAEVERRITNERKMWELQQEIRDLKKDSVGSGDKIVEAVERIGKTPLGQMIAMKFLGMTSIPPEMLAGMNGTPAPAPNGAGDTDAPPTDADEKFYSEMAEVAKILGTTEHGVSARLLAFAQNNPDMARQVFSGNLNTNG